MKLKQEEIFNKYNSMGLYGREALIVECWKEAQKERDELWINKLSEYNIISKEYKNNNSKVWTSPKFIQNSINKMIADDTNKENNK